MNDQHASARRHVLLISQVYVPDPAAVGQVLADAAADLVHRGHSVTVLASASGYDQPAVAYPRREELNGVTVIRLPFASFGKRSLAVRMAGGLLFVIQCAVRGVFVPRVDRILVSTSPPFAVIAGLFISRLRRVPLKFWIMDVNPDQAIALGVIGERSAFARGLRGLLRLGIRSAADIIVLDDFMAERVRRLGAPKRPLHVIPPWSPIPKATASARSVKFRDQFGLAGKLVVLFSGNHGPTASMHTLLAIAGCLRDEPNLAFVFVGGGTNKADVRREPLSNVLSLPYQPPAVVAEIFATADIHAVIVGDKSVGIVHPSKIYAALDSGRPVLLIGPADSPAGRIVAEYGVGWRIETGAVENGVRILREAITMGADERTRIGARGRAALAAGLTRETLRARACDVIEA